MTLAEEVAQRAALALDNARLYQEARDAIALRDQFLSIAAHELKTPLTVLLGKGSTFMVCLPLKHDTSETVQHRAGADTPLSNA